MEFIGKNPDVHVAFESLFVFLVIIPVVETTTPNKRLFIIIQFTSSGVFTRRGPWVLGPPSRFKKKINNPAELVSNENRNYA